MTDVRCHDEPGGPAHPPRESIDPARALAAAAPWVQRGTLAIGLAYAIGDAGLLLVERSSRSFDARLGLCVHIVAVLLTCGVLGLAARRLLAAGARLVDVQVARAEAAGRTALWCETTLAPALHRLIEALERSSVERSSAAAPMVDPTERLNVLRQAIAAREWAAAAQHVRDFEAAYPEHPQTARLAVELAHGREAATHDLRARLDAARAANDPDRVLELREALADLLADEPRRVLDRDLGKWFLLVIQKRLRAGGVRPEIPLLAARIADELDATPEGASLRAALPTLRRSAGLCARCAEPYGGVADACPKCLASGPAAPVQPVVPQASDDERDDGAGYTNGRADDPFVREDSE